MQVKTSNRQGRFFVCDDGEGLSGRAGVGLLAAAADRVGLTGRLCEATEETVDWRDHHPGEVLRDVVLTLADGGTALRHMGVLDGQEQLFGEVASPATACRTIDAVANDDDAMAGLAAARKATRAQVWQAGGAPPVVAAAEDPEVEDPDEPLVIDVDATLIEAGSDDKHGAAATFKGGFGFHPILACLDRGDGSGEALVGRLRSGGRPAHVAADNIAVINQATAQLPELPDSVDLLIRGDSALATHGVVDHLDDQNLDFSVSYPLSQAVKDAIRNVDDGAWQPAIRQDGSPREGAAVVELTDTVDLDSWPDDTRLIVRSEPLHPGAQQTLADIDGRRFTALLTDQEGGPVQLEARHRARAHVEDRIRIAKNTGMRKLPCETFARNALWLQLVLAACDLMVFTQQLALDGELATVEPTTLRNRILHVAARITHHGRQVFVHLDADWPWIDELVAAFGRLAALPVPAG